jgi:GNAT superfamily N-acetyltransferase
MGVAADCCAGTATEEAGSLLGFGVLDARTAFINATYVSPAAARRGGGRSLMEAMETSARAGGGTELRLNAKLNAVPFYARLGHASSGPSSNRLPSGIELPCITMSKPLVQAR